MGVICSRPKCIAGLSRGNYVRYSAGKTVKNDRRIFGEAAISINVYIKGVTELQFSAMDVLSAKLEKETNNNLATGAKGLRN